MFSSLKKNLFFPALGIFIFIPFLAQAGWFQSANFYIEPSYDASSRNKIEAQLIKTTNRIYFYGDSDWLNSLSSSQKQELNNRLYDLANEFEYKIYPTLTSNFGFEDSPGLDQDPRIIIIFHKMKTGVNGYVRLQDGYPLSIYPQSNQGETIFLNSDIVFVASFNQLAYYLSHEFMHLITLNQKDKTYKTNEEVWLNEARSEYTETLLGYDSDWENSNLRKRAQQFLDNNQVSLLEWQNRPSDYAKVNLFIQYLVGQYGPKILIDSLHSSKVGIESLEEALRKNGYQESFSDIFKNWLIANVVNDCQINERYCYKKLQLKNFFIMPYSYYLPTYGQSVLSVTDSLYSWVGKWQKINGGMGILEMKWMIPEETPIEHIPYIVIDKNGGKKVGFLDFSKTNQDQIFVSDYGSENVSLITIPFLADSHPNKLYYYSWEVTSKEQTKENEEQTIAFLKQKIEELKRQVAQLQLQLAMLKTNQENANCSFFSADLYYGISSSEVKCLQQFLANLGEGIYPEKLITGYYGPLTQAAVKRYQALKGIITTGYFGPLTRAKVNQEL